MKSGCYTALITPFDGAGAVDYQGLDRLVAYQIENGITGILAVGTTGESPTLSWEEHKDAITAIAEGTHNRCLCIAGTGSNNTREALEATRHAVAVSNGTAALHSAMFAVNIGPGDEVIVPAVTFAATANCVVYQGGTPIFADVHPEACNPSLVATGSGEHIGGHTGVPVVAIKGGGESRAGEVFVERFDVGR